MAPSKKPLFDPPPPTTLDHFFAKPGTSSSRGVSSQTQKRIKTSHLSSQNTRQRTKRVKTPGVEIIVLDSDDDVPTANTKRKAEDHAGGSSDIEVVEDVAQCKHDASSLGKKAKMESGPKLDDFGTQDLSIFSQDDSPFAEFGKPQLLIPVDEDPNSQDDPHPHCPLLGIQDDSPGVFPTNLAQADSDNIINIHDEWGTGDDELAKMNLAEVDDVLELTDDDEIQEALKLEDEAPATSGDTLDQCPFCGITLANASLLVSSISRSVIVLPLRFHIRACSPTLLVAMTRFPLWLLRIYHLSHLTIHLHHQHHPEAKGQLTATHSRYSCPRTKRTMHGRKLKLQKIAISGQQRQTEGVGRPPFTKSYKACPLPSMLSATVKFLA